MLVKSQESKRNIVWHLEEAYCDKNIDIDYDQKKNVIVKKGETTICNDVMMIQILVYRL